MRSRPEDPPAAMAARKLGLGGIHIRRYDPLHVRSRHFIQFNVAPQAAREQSVAGHPQIELTTKIPELLKNPITADPAAGFRRQSSHQVPVARQNNPPRFTPSFENFPIGPSPVVFTIIPQDPKPGGQPTQHDIRNEKSGRKSRRAPFARRPSRPERPFQAERPRPLTPEVRESPAEQPTPP